MKIIKMEQNSPEWLDWRKSKIGASDVPIILGVSKWSTPYELWQRKIGFKGDVSDNSHMQRGRELEPVVRDLVNTELKSNFVAEVVEHEELEWATASLDGYDEATNMLLEIKCANQKDHDTAASGNIPSHYFPQVQWQFFVSGLEEGYYASYRNEDLQLVKIKRDDEYLSKILPVVAEFYKCMVELIEPEKTETDSIEIEDDGFEQDAKAWKEAHELANMWMEKEKFYKNKLISYTDDGDCHGYGVELKRIKRDGNVDWKGFWETIQKEYPDIKETLSPDNFKKESIGYWKVSLAKT